MTTKGEYVASMNDSFEHQKELGKLIAEREGLDLNKVAQEWDATEAGAGQVMVTLRLPIFITKAEYEAMSAQAWQAIRGQ